MVPLYRKQPLHLQVFKESPRKLEQANDARVRERPRFAPSIKDAVASKHSQNTVVQARNDIGRHIHRGSLQGEE